MWNFRPDMKRIISCAVAALVLFVSSGSAQSPAAENDQRLLALIQQVKAQQAQIASNQEKIDSKMAEVAEAVRLARIFAGRGGK
jgi:outer membrane lipoprotein-sorting protein